MRNEFLYKAIITEEIIAKHPALPNRRLFFTWRDPNEGMLASHFESLRKKYKSKTNREIVNDHIRT